MSCIAAATELEELDESGDITDAFDCSPQPPPASRLLLLLLLPLLALRTPPDTAGMFIGAAAPTLEDTDDDTPVLREVGAPPEFVGADVHEVDEDRLLGGHPEADP